MSLDQLAADMRQEYLTKAFTVAAATGYDLSEHHHIAEKAVAMASALHAIKFGDDFLPFDYDMYYPESDKAFSRILEFCCEEYGLPKAPPKMNP